MSLSEEECHCRRCVIVGCPYVMWYLPVEGACSSGRRCVFGGGMNLKKGVCLCWRGCVFVGGGVYLWEKYKEACHSGKRCVLVGVGLFLRKEVCPSKSRCILVGVGKYFVGGMCPCGSGRV